MKISLPKIRRPKIGLFSSPLILSGMVAFVGFGATFGLRWALLAAVLPLILLGVAVSQ